jgi:hypothetical protein
MHAIRFLHIPKTAGSTLSSILQRQYLGKKMFSLSGNPNIDEQNFSLRSEHYKANTKLFLGHSQIKSGIERADTGIIITILRDPVERVKSFCQHAAEGKSEYLRDRFPPESFNLDDFLASGDISLSNLQTRFLIGHAKFETLNKNEAIEQALENLFNKISYYGIQEHFDESLIIFSKALNWRLPVYIRKNTRDPKKQITFESRHIEIIQRLNETDIAVYNQAKANFMQKINSQSFDKAKLVLLQRKNKDKQYLISLEYKLIDLLMRSGAAIKNIVPI